MQFLVGACIKHHKYTRVYVFRMKGGYGTAAISTQSTLQPGGKGSTSGYFPPHQHTKIFPSFVCVCAHSRGGGGKEPGGGGGEPSAFGGAPRAAGDNGRLTSVEQTPIFPDVAVSDRPSSSARRPFVFSFFWGVILTSFIIIIIFSFL